MENIKCKCNTCRTPEDVEKVISEETARIERFAIIACILTVVAIFTSLYVTYLMILE